MNYTTTTNGAKQYTSSNDVCVDLFSKITDKLKQHHNLYRFPCKAEPWEDIWDQILNGWKSKWIGGGHSSGADVISESNDKTRYQNKSGNINYDNNTIEWNGHRTTKHKTLKDKIDFISQNHYDKYVMLGRNAKDWKMGIKRYGFGMFNSDLIDYTELEWTETTNKNGKVTGWKGENDNLPYSAKIVISMSDQLWTTCDIDYIGGLNYIEI